MGFKFFLHVYIYINLLRWEYFCLEETFTRKWELRKKLKTVDILDKWYHLLWKTQEVIFQVGVNASEIRQINAIVCI